jgi:hypothetical protein
LGGLWALELLSQSWTSIQLPSDGPPTRSHGPAFYHIEPRENFHFTNARTVALQTVE